MVGKIKTCSKCKQEKTVDEFYKDKWCSDGLSPSCKGCKNVKSPRLEKKERLLNHGLKECQKCFIIKSISYFIEGRNECCDCYKNKCKKYYEENKGYICKQMKDKRQKEPWKYILKWINDRCYLKSSTGYINYGEKGIENFLNEQDVKFLWFRDKAYEMKRPSIDRIDYKGNYCLQNCQFIELLENISKEKRKSILQYDLDGNFIKEWKSITEAQNIYGHCIIDCLRGKTKSSKSFVWRYK